VTVKPIDRDTSLEELAATVSQVLERAGITATLSGGGAVTLYADNEYLSGDLDFVTSARIEVIGKVLAPLGFVRNPGARQFEHPDTDFYVEFPPGPLAFGETSISQDDATTVDTRWGPLRIVTPTQLVMDRLAAYVHWRDGQSLDQAVMIARHQAIDWSELHAWAEREGIEPALIDGLQRRAGAD